MFAGARMEEAMAMFNERLGRQGQGWLPARFMEAVDQPAGTAAKADVSTFQHPALELFRKGSGGAFAGVAFSRWCKLKSDGAGSVVARLSNGDPLLVEKVYGNGRA